MQPGCRDQSSVIQAVVGVGQQPVNRSPRNMAQRVRRGHLAMDRVSIWGAMVNYRRQRIAQPPFRAFYGRRYQPVPVSQPVARRRRCGGCGRRLREPCPRAVIAARMPSAEARGDAPLSHQLRYPRRSRQSLAPSDGAFLPDCAATSLRPTAEHGPLAYGNQMRGP